MAIGALILCSVICFFVFKLISRAHNYWRERNVKSPNIDFIFGNVKDFVLMKKHPGDVLKNAYDSFPQERFVGIYSFFKPQLILRDLEDIKAVMITNFNNFQNRSNFVDHDSWSPSLAKNLFNMRFGEWKPTRQKLTPAFTSGKLKNMFHLITDIGDELVKYTSSLITKYDTVEVNELMAKFSTDVIGSCAFGINMDSMHDEDALFRKMGRKIFKVNFKKFVILSIRSMFPKLFRLLRLKVIDDDVEYFFKTAIADITEERQSSGIKRHDFVDIMLELKNAENETEQQQHGSVKIDNNFIAAQSFIFFVAGFETSSGLMSFALHELALHQEIQDKLYEEIVGMLDKNGGKLTYEGVKEMTYLEMVVNETQRMYPAASVLPRICTAPYTFPNSDLKLSKDMTVFIPVKAIHYDPNYYTDPEKFNPDRFEPELKKNMHPMTFLPFGEGPRNCIGLRFGKMQSKIGLISLLKDFRVEPCSKTEIKLEINVRSPITRVKNGIWLKLTRRNKLKN